MTVDGRKDGPMRLIDALQALAAAALFSVTIVDKAAADSRRAGGVKGPTDAAD